SATDLAILFTCAFCQSKVADMLAEIQRIRSIIKDGCELIVGSCLPKTDKAALGRIFQGRTVTPTDFSSLNELPGITTRIEDVPWLGAADAACAVGQLVPPRPGETADPMGKRGMGLFIASGCRRRCSYCAIRFATGPLRSKPLPDVIAMFHAGLAAGYRQFEVHADSIGDYGLDIGTDLGALFDEWSQDSRDFTCGIYDLHPQAFLRFLDKVQNLGATGHLHYLYVPLQSGHPRILKQMNRPCSLPALLRGLRKFQEFPGVFLQTSIIVGFPGETEEEFDSTVEFLRVAAFDDIYVHCYSDMPETKSAGMADKIDKETMKRRLDRLEGKGLRYNLAAARHEWENLPF
ncbi:MAG TPA: radical SAM protein, partial [Candidatus Aminicenantes bacterium]|nr:radical SAM protein [Candidatus Aminicenantes bacterium]